METSKVIYSAIKDFYRERLATQDVDLPEGSIKFRTLTTIGHITKALAIVDGESDYAFYVSANQNTGNITIELLENADVYSTTYTKALGDQ